MVSLVTPTHSLKGKPHYRRTQQVYAVLDASPSDATYDRLIEYVRQSTGKGCSRKLISKWKKLTILDGAYPPSSPNLKSKPTSQEITPAPEVKVNTEELPIKDELLVTETHCSRETTLDNNQAEVEKSPYLQSTFAHEDEQSTYRAVSLEPSIDCPHNLIENTEPKAKNSHPLPEKLLQVAKNTWSYVAATAIVVGIAGCGWFLSKDNSQPVVAQTTSIHPAEFKVQNASPDSESDLIQNPKSKIQNQRVQNGLPRTIKINLTLTSPQDLKVKPGDEVTPGTVLSDRTTERQRLLAQKKQLEISLKKLDLPIPEITQPKPIPALSKLPPVSYQQEEANIALKQQELAEAEKAIANQEEKIRQLRELLPATQPLEVVQKNSDPEQNFSEIATNSILLPKPEADSDRKNESSITATKEKGAETPVALIIEHEQVILEQLATAKDKAKLQVDIAKSQLLTAKERRAHAEYQRYVEETRRTIAIQQQQIELERQRSIRAGQIQEREYSKAQIETKIQEIDNAIAQLSTVKAPYAGKIKKIKWTGQDNHNLTVQLTLDVDDGSEKPTITSKQ